MKSLLFGLIAACLAISTVDAQNGVVPLAKGALHVSEMSFGHFGTVEIYRPRDEPANMVLFISGDGGWNDGIKTMAQQLALQDTTVIGIDMTVYRKWLADAKSCSYPAGEFEALSQYVQQQLHFKTYHRPILVGYSSGATLAYGLLGQAPTGTFLGGVALGYCKTLENVKAFCKSNGLTYSEDGEHHGISFDPMSHIRQPFVLLQGGADPWCTAPSIKQFFAGVSNVRMMTLPNVDHLFSKPKDWLPAYTAAYHQIVQESRAASLMSAPKASARSDAPVSDLPIIETAASRPEGDTFAILITGDGGWAGIDQEVSQTLAANGVPVAALDSLKYFWTKRTPESASADVTRMIRHYAKLWGKERVILIGYSFGADAMPFIASRLPADLASRVRLLALMGLSPKAEFEFHVGSWIGLSSDAAYPTEPEMKKISDFKALCIYGEGESDTLCPKLRMTNVQPLKVGEGHHFGGDYIAITKDILKNAGL